MNKEKQNLIKRSMDNFKKLPQEKKILVLGIMQGILLEQSYVQNKQADIDKLLTL